MTYPQQNDYGGANGHQADAQLVPGGLRVYRHYRMHEHGLTSTITTTEPVKPGVNTAKCLAVPYTRADKNCARCQGKGEYQEAVRAPQSLYRSFLDKDDYDFSLHGLSDTTVVQRTCDCLRKCSAPDRNCQCGFYASYDPELDFFGEYINQLRSNGGGFGSHDIPSVFAVVEASGRVLMGSKGVRAEKMRVVAMAIDVNHVRCNYHNPYAGLSPFSLARGRFNNGLSANEMFMRGMAEPEPADLLQEYVDALDRLQFAYCARSYGTAMDRMIQDYPQPDISHLIKGASNG